MNIPWRILEGSWETEGGDHTGTTFAWADALEVYSVADEALTPQAMIMWAYKTQQCTIPAETAQDEKI